jgi:hypothetical protein
VIFLGVAVTAIDHHPIVEVEFLQRPGRLFHVGRFVVGAFVASA